MGDDAGEEKAGARGAGVVVTGGASCCELAPPASHSSFGVPGREIRLLVSCFRHLWCG